MCFCIDNLSKILYNSEKYELSGGNFNMYERSAIVLERYFDNEIGYSEKCNLRDNFNNYCKWNI